MADIKAFKELVGEIQDLRTTQALLGWDLEVFMPEKGSRTRAQQLATLSKFTHQMLTSTQMEELLTELRTPKKLSKLSHIEQAMVREIGKEHDREKKISAELVQEMTMTTAEAMPLWAEARKKSDFQLFAPILKKIVSLNIDMAKAIGYKTSPYDALLDLYEPDLTTTLLDPLFANLKNEIIPLVKAIQDSSKKPDTGFLYKHYSQDKQMAFSKDVLEAMEFDFKRGRLDLSVHPFSSGTSAEDVRLTTRVFENHLFSCLSSAMHEGGHGLYEQGVDLELLRTSLDSGTSLGIHESQSRMWENLVGRSETFWKHFFPRLKKYYPRKLADITTKQFYAAINEVKPSAIRVESDEVTYNLHIVLRYEIEKALIEGQLSVKDIPHVWHEKMKEYIGYSPKDDSEGCLQDVHWSHGSFGYFPTYTLGNLYSAQFFRVAHQQMPDLSKDIGKGKLKPLKKWLNEQIHHVGKMESPQEIIQRVTGEPLSAHYFVDYLWTKYGSLYDLKRPTPALNGKSKIKTTK
jgi:carboxypeptidase Taq